MHAIFPGLFFLGPLVAPVILRLAVSIAFFLYAKRVWSVSKRGRLLALKESFFGLLLLSGFLVQIAAPLGILVVLGREWWLKGDAPRVSWRERILMIGILVVLTLTGAGALAIDLPY